MKTIAISIDEETLARIDEIALRRKRRTRAERRVSRSSVIRVALQEFLAGQDRSVREEAERRIFARHRQKLDRQAAALIREQASR